MDTNTNVFEIYGKGRPVNSTMLIRQAEALYEEQCIEDAYKLARQVIFLVASRSNLTHR